MKWLIRSGIKQEQRAISQVWNILNDSNSPMLASGILCAGHGEDLGGESPLRAVEIGTASLGQGAESDLGSEGSR